jgi:hypothetical protein
VGDTIVENAARMVGISTTGEVQVLRKERWPKMFDRVVAWSEEGVGIDRLGAAENSCLS